MKMIKQIYRKMKNEFQSTLLSVKKSNKKSKQKYQKYQKNNKNNNNKKIKSNKINIKQTLKAEVHQKIITREPHKTSYHSANML